MVRSAAFPRVALLVGSLLLGAAAFGATGAAAHERGYYVPAPVYYVPAPTYYAPPRPVYYAPPVYYVPAPAPVYGGGSMLEFMLSFGDNDRRGHSDRGDHDRGRHNGWSHGRGHDRD